MLGAIPVFVFLLLPHDEARKSDCMIRWAIRVVCELVSIVVFVPAYFSVLTIFIVVAYQWQHGWHEMFWAGYGLAMFNCLAVYRESRRAARVVSPSVEARLGRHTTAFQS